MTDKQRHNLASVASAIAKGRPALSESFAVGQVMLVTGKSWRDSLKGVELMQTEKLFPPAFIKPETAGVLGRLVGKHPSIAILLERFECLPGITQELDYQPFCRPKKLSENELIKIFSLPPL